MNLDFESAHIQPEDPLGFAPVSTALPGWSAYIGTREITEVLYDNESLGSTAVGLLGTFHGGTLVLEGGFTLLMQAGVDSMIGGSADASIAQSGLVPEDALSIQMKVLPIGPVHDGEFSVSLGGSSIDMIPIMEHSEYTLYGGDVSAWSGLSTELRITGISDPEFGLRNMLFDTIVFSSQPIPEPRTWAFLSLGTLLLGWRMRRAKRH